MTGSRQMRLDAFMRPVGIHTAWWRYPGAAPDANFNLKHLIRFAQKLEAGRFDTWIMADHPAVLNMPMAALKRSATVTSFDPLTLLPVLAMARRGALPRVCRSRAALRPLPARLRPSHRRRGDGVVLERLSRHGPAPGGARGDGR